MKKLYILAALLMATTSAHAGGGGVTFQISGGRIHVEAPRHCNALSCIKDHGARIFRLDQRHRSQGLWLEEPGR